MNLFKIILQNIYIKFLFINKFFFTKKNFGSHYCYLNFYFKFYDVEKWINNHKVYDSLKIKKKIIFFDVGAHVGLVQLLLLKKLKNSKKFLFEPNNINFKFLKINLQKNNIKNTLFYNVGLSKNIGFANFGQTKTVSAVSMIGDTGKSKVRTLNLDYFYKKNIIPDIIKIDVEGHEFRLLQGAKLMLKYHNPVLILSIHQKNLKNNNISLIKLNNYLSQYSYNIKNSDLIKLKKCKNMEVVLIKKK